MRFKKWNEEQSDELKPCPFCGSDDLEVQHIGNELRKKRSIKVRCKKCRCEREDGAIHHSFEWLEGIIIKNWNQRPEGGE